MLRGSHGLLCVVNRGVNREAQDFIARKHLCAYRNRHGNQASCCIGVVWGCDNGAAIALGGSNDTRRNVCIAANDEALSTAIHGKLLCFVAVGAENDIALFDHVLHHFRGGADAHFAACNNLLRIAKHHGGIERREDVLVSGS